MTGRALIRALSGTASLVAVAACLLPGSAFAATAGVEVAHFAFTPKALSINQGDQVTWTWTGSGSDGQHDVYEGAPPPLPTDPIPPALFESHPQAPTKDDITGPPPGGTWSYTFNDPGTYQYWCRRHRGMTASVTVAAVEQPPPLTPADATQVSQLAPPKAVCVSKRNFKIRIRQPRGTSRIAAVKVTVNGVPVTASLEGRRFTAPVDLRGFASGTYEVQIVAATADGQTLRGARRYKTCAPKVTSSALPRL